MYNGKWENSSSLNCHIYPYLHCQNDCNEITDMFSNNISHKDEIITNEIVIILNIIHYIIYALGKRVTLIWHQTCMSQSEQQGWSK